MKSPPFLLFLSAAYNRMKKRGKKSCTRAPSESFYFCRVRVHSTTARARAAHPFLGKLMANESESDIIIWPPRLLLIPRKTRITGTVDHRSLFFFARQAGLDDYDLELFTYIFYLNPKSSICGYLHNLLLCNI